MAVGYNWIKGLLRPRCNLRLRLRYRREDSISQALLMGVSSLTASQGIHRLCGVVEWVTRPTERNMGSPKNPSKPSHSCQGIHRFCWVVEWVTRPTERNLGSPKTPCKPRIVARAFIDSVAWLNESTDLLRGIWIRQRPPSIRRRSASDRNESLSCAHPCEIEWAECSLKADRGNRLPLGENWLPHAQRVCRMPDARFQNPSSDLQRWTNAKDSRGRGICSIVIGMSWAVHCSERRRHVKFATLGPGRIDGVSLESSKPSSGKQCGQRQLESGLGIDGPVFGPFFGPSFGPNTVTGKWRAGASDKQRRIRSGISRLKV